MKVRTEIGYKEAAELNTVGTAPPEVAFASDAGTLDAAARADHTHGDAIHRASTVGDLQALGSANNVTQGDVGQITRTGNRWVCTSVTGPNSSLWRPADNVWRVRDYVTTSNASDVNTVIADLPSTGGVIEVEQGVWTMDVQMVIDETKDNVILRGAGSGRGTLFRGTALAVPYLRLGSGVYAASPNLSNVQIQNLSFDHATGGPAGSGGIQMWNCRDCTIEGCDIRNLVNGIILEGESRYNTVRKNHTIGNTFDCILRNGARSNWVHENSFQGASDTTILLQGGADAGLTANVIWANGIEGFTNFGIDYDSSTNVVSQSWSMFNRVESTVPGSVGVNIDANSQFIETHDYFQGVTTNVVNAVADTAVGATRVSSNPIFNLLQLADANGTRRGLVRSGTGDPNGVITGDPGDMWLRTDGGAGTSLYIKEAGVGTTANWVGK